MLRHNTIALFLVSLAASTVEGYSSVSDHDVASLSSSYSSLLSHINSAAADLSSAVVAFTATDGPAAASSVAVSQLHPFVAALHSSVTGVIGSGLDFTTGLSDIQAMVGQITGMLDAIASKAAEFASASNYASGSTATTYDAHSAIGSYLYDAAAAWPLAGATVSAVYAYNCDLITSLQPAYDAMVSDFSAAVTAYEPSYSVALETLACPVEVYSSAVAASNSTTEPVTELAGNSTVWPLTLVPDASVSASKKTTTHSAKANLAAPYTAGGAAALVACGFVFLL